MIKYFLFVIFFAAVSFSQVEDSTFSELHSQKNILRFADYLFCEKDYLRAAEEYLRINELARSETTKYKIALSYSTIGDFASSRKYFSQITETSEFFELSKLELMKIIFLEGNFSGMRQFSDAIGLKNSKLYMISFLKDREKIPEGNEFLKPFNENEKPAVADFYRAKVSPEKKHPLLASLMSAVIPGSGKIYTGAVTDGIFAFLTTGLFTFLAYDNFKADHTFRGWLFSSLAAGFYAGNVYGSYASAQIFNAQVSYEFNLRLDLFLKTVNYFIPEYDFCE